MRGCAPSRLAGENQCGGRRHAKGRRGPIRVKPARSRAQGLRIERWNHLSTGHLSTWSVAECYPCRRARSFAFARYLARHRRAGGFLGQSDGSNADHFRDLFFSLGVLPTKSVREYYREVTNGLIDIQGDVVGPFRMPQTLASYAHGGSGLGSALPNARTMARDAALAANPTVNFTPYDNDGDGFVDAFIVIHAGPGA